VSRGLRSLAAVAVVVGVIALAFAWFNRDDKPDPAPTTESRPKVERDVQPFPADMPTEGMYVASDVAADGSVEVSTWIRSAQPVEQLSMTTTDPDLLPGSVESLDLVVRTMDGKMLAHRDTVGTNPQTIRLRQAATELYFSYTVDGAMDTASPTVPGRTLARVLAMDVDYAGAAGTVRRLVSSPGTVLNVACLDPAQDFDAVPRPCGQATADGDWVVDLTGAQRQDRLLASIES
jgi:hypothetical protein